MPHCVGKSVEIPTPRSVDPNEGAYVAEDLRRLVHIHFEWRVVRRHCTKAVDETVCLRRVRKVAHGAERARHKLAARPYPLGLGQYNFVRRTGRDLSSRIPLEEYDISSIVKLDAVLIARSELLPEHLIKLVHASHPVVDAV
jgi:hypothetical protein